MADAEHEGRDGTCCSQMIQSPVALCAEAPCGARGTRGRREPKRSSSCARDGQLEARRGLCKLQAFST
eukprot:1215466-Rhodomonas_salina.3